MAKDKSDAVGYGRPPKHAQFRKGRSGNPKGRPKGAKNLKTDLVEELSERISISEGGKAKTLSKQRALLKSATAKAIKGDARALSILLNLMLKVIGPDERESETPIVAADDVAILADFIKKQSGRRPATEEEAHHGGN